MRSQMQTGLLIAAIGFVAWPLCASGAFAEAQNRDGQSYVCVQVQDVFLTHDGKAELAAPPPVDADAVTFVHLPRLDASRAIIKTAEDTFVADVLFRSETAIAIFGSGGVLMLITKAQGSVAMTMIFQASPRSQGGVWATHHTCR